MTTTNLRRWLWLPSALLLTVLVAACGDGDGKIAPSDPAPTALSYSSPTTAVVGTAIVPLDPTVTGMVDNYTVSPALPDGLSINATTGRISGTPTTATAQANYTITAANTSGNTTFVLVLTVEAAASPPTALSYPSPQVFTVGTAITALNPTVTGSVTSYTVSPALPAGLSINSGTGVISGTPTTVTATATYTVTAANVAGSTTFGVVITVNVVAPTALSYTSPQNLTVGTALTPLSPTVTGTVSSFTVSPALPAGLSINATSGVISGTPTAVTASATYTVTATNSGGFTTFGLVIAVAAAPVGAPVVTLGIGIKQLQFSWPSVAGATHYKLLQNPDGASGYTQVGGNLATTSATIDIAVHTQDWANASYIVQACDGGGCTDSSAVNTLGRALEAIGYLKASNSDGNGSFPDSFGVAIALSGNGLTLAVASREASNATGVNGNQADNSTNNAGAVYVFVRSGGTWVQQAYLKQASTDAFDNFGNSLALSDDGNTLAVGMAFDDSNASGIGGDPTNNALTNAGSVYVFTRSAGTWTQQAYIKSSNPGQNDFFGSAVALSGDGSLLAVGAYQEDSSATGIDGSQVSNASADSGAVYTFTRTAGVWTPQSYLKASNTDAGDNFGKSVALAGDGQTLVVGAPFEASAATTINGSQADNTANSAGAAYVFVRSGLTWVQQAYVKAANARAVSQFGDNNSVSLSNDGNTLAVGAFNENSGASGINGNAADTSLPAAGAVYVFTRSSGSWSQQAYIKAQFPGNNDNFGFGVGLSSDGNRLVVADVGEDSNATGVGGDQSNDSSTGSGAVMLFGRAGSTWTQRQYLKAPNTGAGDRFALPVISDDGLTIAVGANGEDSSARGIDGDGSDNSQVDSGAAYLY